MPPILLKLIMNKYVIIGMVALSLFGYIKYLNTSLSKAREDAQSYAAVVEQLTYEKELMKAEVAETNKALAVRKTEVSYIKDKSCARQTLLENSTKESGDKEKVDEKNVLGSPLPVDVINALRVQDSPQSN